MDLTYSLGAIIEKVTDLLGAAAVAQADVRQFYDNLRPWLVYKWMQGREAYKRILLTFLRLNCLPQRILGVGSTSCSISSRCFGVLTGAKSAVVAGRISLVDTAIKRIHTWQPLAFAVWGGAVLLGHLC